MKEFSKGFILGVSLMTVFSAIRIGCNTYYDTKRWKREIAERGYAYYHPITGEWQWKEESPPVKTTKK
jgi:hypothetical protein